MQNQIVNIKLINDHIFAIFSKGPSNRIEIGQISHLATSYFISKPRVLDLSKGFSSKAKIDQNKTEALISTFDNNSILLLRPQDGSVLSTIYPPPTPTNIAQTMYCMYLKRVFVLLQTGTICVYKTHDRETATLEKLQFPKELKDYEGKSLNQTITALTLGSITPPRVDCEIFSDVHKFERLSKQKRKKTLVFQNTESEATDNPPTSVSLKP